jgi:dTDP-4-amino-4,6-dideoxygalactose transaminase
MRVPFVDLSPMHRQVGARLDGAWRSVRDGGQFILGKEADEFQRRFAFYCETEFCVGVANGLDAIALILQALEIGPGDEVIVPANTFIATWLAVSKVGASPIPADCELSTGNIAPAAAQAAITARTRAIIPVHLYGRPADLSELSRIAQSAGIHLVEDAAQAHGARFRGRRVGSFGIAAAFSFYPTKNLGALGDGGAVTTNDQSFAEKIRRLGNYGATTKYHHEIAGGNSRLDELQAAFLTAKLAHLDDWNAERRHIAETYGSELQSVPGLHLPPPSNHSESVYHLYTVRTAERDRLASDLAANGVQTVVHYPTPPHLQPAFAHLGYQRGAFPAAERISAEILSLPIWPGMNAEAISHVTRSVRGALAGGTDAVRGQA